MAMRTSRKYLAEDRGDTLFVHDGFSVSPEWSWSNIQQNIIGDTTRTDVTSVKVQIGGTRPVITVRRMFKTRVTRISVHAAAIRSDGLVLIASQSRLRNVKGAGEILHVDLVQQRDLNLIPYPRPKRGAGSWDAVRGRPDFTGIVYIIAFEITHLSCVWHTTRCQVGLFLIEDFQHSLQRLT